jgi:hypothetical protein
VTEKTEILPPQNLIFAAEPLARDSILNNPALQRNLYIGELVFNLLVLANAFEQVFQWRGASDKRVNRDDGSPYFALYQVWLSVELLNELPPPDSARRDFRGVGWFMREYIAWVYEAHRRVEELSKSRQRSLPPILEKSLFEYEASLTPSLLLEFAAVLT